MQEAQSLTARDRSRRVLRSVVGGVVLAAALALAAVAVWSKRTELAHGLHRLPALAVVLSSVCGVGAVFATLFLWRAVLAGFGIELGLSESARVFFVGQLGKYLPGSVWPIVAQMELGRRHNVGRKTMLAAGTVTVVLNVVVGGIIACALLPFVSRTALSRFWWLLPCVPVLAAGLHPRIALGVINRLLHLVRREPLPETLTVRSELKAAGWGVVSWTLLGGHIYALVAGLGVTGPHAVAASIAAGCLAISVGILLIPVPAGAGVREVAFVLVLAPVLTTASGLLVALLSRLILIAVDVLLAAVFGLRKWPARRSI